MKKSEPLVSCSCRCTVLDRVAASDLVESSHLQGPFRSSTRLHSPSATGNKMSLEILPLPWIAQGGNVLSMSSRSIPALLPRPPLVLPKTLRRAPNISFMWRKKKYTHFWKVKWKTHFRKYARLSSENVVQSPVSPSQEPKASAPSSIEPSHRAPTPRPFSHVAQSVVAVVNSPVTVHMLPGAKPASVGRIFWQAYCMCSSPERDSSSLVKTWYSCWKHKSERERKKKKGERVASRRRWRWDVRT